jgi:hypothetical protein
VASITASKRTQLSEELADLVRLATVKRLALHHDPLLGNHANRDSLLVEVVADKKHGALLLWKKKQLTSKVQTNLFFLPRTPEHLRLDLLPFP